MIESTRPGTAEAMPERLTKPLDRPNASIQSLSSSGCLREQAERLRMLFEGYDEAFGLYNAISEEREDGKLIGKDRRTVRATLTIEHYEAHFAGKSGLGIIPIRSDNNVKFGAIDVDVYADLSHIDLAQRIANQKLPMIVCRSKSGGAHVFCFTAEPVPASRMQARLREVAALLGHGSAEIFPKQSKVLAEKGDLGSWINIPYFADTRGNRFGIRPEDGEPMNFDEFFEHAEARRAPADWFSIPLTVGNDDLPQGPPCLQHLVQLGFPPGTRNQGLFNLGVYASKADPENWKARLDDLNHKYMDPPLGSEEVEVIKRSLSKKSYGFRCNDQPIMSHCDRTACRGRKFGIGTECAGTQIQSLSKLDCDPPRYFVTLERGRIEITLEELLDPLRFQRAVAAKLNTVPPVSKRDKWASNIDVLMQTMEIIPAPEDASECSRLWHSVERFCTSRAVAIDKSEVLTNRVWRDAGRVYFTSAALASSLERYRIKVSMAELWALLRSRGAEHHRAEKLKGKVVRLWSLPDFDQQTERFDIPEGIAGEFDQESTF